MSGPGPGPATVDSSSAGGQSSVTPTSQMNGMITSQSHDSAERSPSPGADVVRAGDVIKSSLPRPLDEASAVSCADVIDTAQPNEVRTAAVDNG